MATSINNIKTYSALLSGYGVEIPLIQRDYVQGRVRDTKKYEGKGDETSKKLLKKYLRERERRDNFVSQLIEALDDPSAHSIQLTFIYGTTEDTGTHPKRQAKSLIPLDGQQRLTTLFLLAWILIHELSDTDRKAYESNTYFQEFYKGMNSFSYKTRPSSGAFCFSIMNEIIQPSAGSISEILLAQSWFGDDWKMDPSVKAMLQMLDKMEEMLKNKNAKTLFDNLLNGKGIEFELLEMEDYKLTDGLYVKMNARGKQLTEFENWKSEFIEFLEDNHSSAQYDKIDSVTLQKVFGNKLPTLKEYFAHSIEHKWTDLFWTYCRDEISKHEQELSANSNPSKRDKDCYPVIDEYFMNVFEKLTQILFYVNNPNKKSATDYKPSKETRNEIYKNDKNVKELFAFFDLLCSFDDNFFNELFYTTKDNQATLQNGKIRLLGDNDTNTNLLSRCALNENSTDTSNVMLYALLRYANKYGSTIDGDMKYFIRAIRNRIESNQYLSTKEVRMVNDFNIYDIVSKKVLDKIDQLIAEKVNGTANWTITNEEAAIEDLSFICGNLRIKISTSTSMQIYEVFKAWDNLPDIEKVQLLIGYGFTGHRIMTCGHGELFLFGPNGIDKDNNKYRRWKPLFVHDDSRGNGNIDQAFNDIVKDYLNLSGTRGVIGLQTLLKQKKIAISTNPSYNFIYYALNYDSFMMAHAHNKKSNYYFSVNDSIDKMNIAAMQYSGKPTMAYHTDPIVYTLKKTLQNQKTNNSTNSLQTLYLGYSVTGSNRACLYIYDTKWWDGKDPIAILRHKDGLHGNGGWEQLDVNNNIISCQNDNATIDRIKAGVNWVNILYPSTIFKEKG